jgi:hypothetical protein
LTAETVIASLEEAEDYKAFEAAVIADYDSQTAVECELVLRLDPCSGGFGERQPLRRNFSRSRQLLAEGPTPTRRHAARAGNVVLFSPSNSANTVIQLPDIAGYLDLWLVMT